MFCPRSSATSRVLGSKTFAGFTGVKRTNKNNILIQMRFSRKTMAEPLESGLKALINLSKFSSIYKRCVHKSEAMTLWRLLHSVQHKRLLRRTEIYCIMNLISNGLLCTRSFAVNRVIETIAAYDDIKDVFAFLLIIQVVNLRMVKI